MAPMLAAAQHPRSPRVADRHRTSAQKRRTNRRVEQAEVREIAARYTRRVTR